MNVSKVAQFEIALLLRTLSIVKTKPKGTVSAFFKVFLNFLQTCPKGSLSALWAKIDGKAVSVVDLTSEDACFTDIVQNIPELDYLKQTEHAESLHDPLLFIRSLYDTAVGDIVHSSNADRSILLSAAMLMGFKSERSSVIIHALIIFHLLKDDVELVKDPAIIEFIRDTFHESTHQVDSDSKTESKNGNHSSSKEEERHLRFTPLDDLESLSKILAKLAGGEKEPNGSCVISFGKADHGTCILPVSFSSITHKYFE